MKYYKGNSHTILWVKVTSHISKTTTCLGEGRGKMLKSVIFLRSHLTGSEGEKRGEA